MDDKPPMNMQNEPTPTEDNISLDSKQLELFKFIIDTIIPGIVHTIRDKSDSIKSMCRSNTTSIPIADYMEQRTSRELSIKLDQSSYQDEVYMSGNEGRTDHDRMLIKDGSPFAVLHLENKGVRVKCVWKNYTINQLKESLSKLGHTPILSGRHKWGPLIKYIEDNNLLNLGLKNARINGTRIQYNTNKYSECDRDNDHPDCNFHMKCSQSNLYDFKSRIDGSEVIYKGLIPRDGLHHFTFILKHIFSECHGIHKLILIAVPHCSIQSRYFPDIQKDGTRVRLAKAKDEFRFNMNYANGNPYVFLGTNEPRYKSFTIKDNIDYD